MEQILTHVFDFLINRPLVMMAVFAIPLLAAWYFKRCFPSQLFLVAMLIPCGLSIGLVAIPELYAVIVIVNLLIISVATIDLLTIIAAIRFQAERKLLKIVSLGKKHDCRLTVTNFSKRGCDVQIRDDLPGEFEPDIEKFDYFFKPRSRASFHYQFTSRQRGRYEMHCVHLKVRSRLGFWNAHYKTPVHNQVFVYPDMKQISQFALLARTNRLNMMGVRRSRTIGQDNEFERLRDYTQDDNFKHIDWRSTARRRKLTVKDFQANQSQRIIFLVDCGRMMTGDSGGISMLDHGLNAMLMLSYVALSQGDSVGLICFSDSIHNYTPPRPGVNHINLLLHSAFDQHAAYVESRYDKAFYHLQTNCLKRSLVVLITNVIDQINADQIYQYMTAMGKRHLPMAVLLRDHEMFDVVEDYVEHPNDSMFYPAAVAANIANWRHQVLTDLQHDGVLAVDTYPEQLTANLINRYLEIKAQHLL